MKKVIVILVLVLSSLTTFSQLNPSAVAIKDAIPVTYNEIKLFVEQSWKDDHKMMVYGINKQATAYFKMSDILGSPAYDRDIMIAALVKWKSKIGEVTVYDYPMVIYTYNKQIKAKGQY